MLNLNFTLLETKKNFSFILKKNMNTINGKQFHEPI